MNKKAGHTLKSDKSFSVDNFDDDLIYYCDNAVSNLSKAKNLEKPERTLDNWLVRKSPDNDQVIYVDDTPIKESPSLVSSPLLYRGASVIPTPVSSNSKKESTLPIRGAGMVPCKHNCKNKKK